MKQKHFQVIRLTTDGKGKVFVQSSSFAPLLIPGDEVIAIDGVHIEWLMVNVKALVKVCCFARRKRALTIARQDTGQRSEVSVNKIKGAIFVAAS